MNSSGKMMSIINNNHKKDYMTVSNYLWNYLVSHDVKYVFGINGGGIVSLIKYIPASITWVNIGNEEQNGFLAQVYGLYSKEVGILMTTYGPGLCNSINPIVNAVKEGNPFLFITSFKPNAKVNDFQNVEYEKILQGATKYYFQINHADEFIKIFSYAYEIAKNKRTGVALMININIFNSKIILKNYSYTCLKENRIATEVKARCAIKNIFTSSKKTLVVLGDGPFWNFDIMKKFIINNNLPYATTSKGRIIFADYNYYVGRMGTIGNHSANYAIYHADYLLVVGNLSGGLTNDISQFYENKFSIGLNQPKNIVQLAIVPETLIINKNNKYTNFIVNNIESIFKDLSVQQNVAWNSFLLNSKIKLIKPLPAKSMLEKYIQVAADIYRYQKLNISVATDVGNHWYAANKFFDMSSVEKWHSPTTNASIGVGFTNGYGMYLAKEEPVWVFAGDGGTSFSINALLYLYTYCKNVPLTIHITLDGLYAAIASAYIMNNSLPLNYDSSIDFPPFMKTNEVPLYDYKQLFPDAIFIQSVEEYKGYISQKPISDSLRIIFLFITDENEYSKSNVYEINFKEGYYNALEKSNFESILNTELVIASED